MSLISALTKDSLRLFIISSLPEVTEYVRGFAHHFGHSIVDFSYFFDSALEDIIENSDDYTLHYIKVVND